MGDQLQVKLRKRLEVLLKLPENQVCADCNKRGPRWVSANLGVFVCIECSGIHRNLGVHISFVRSVNLDSWTVKQVEHLEEWGNGRANAYFEANVPSNVKKPVDGDSVRVVEKYIRDKYEHKRFIAKSVPPKVEHRQEEEPAAEPVVRRSSVAKAPVKTIQTPAPVPVAVPPKVVDLLNFENFEAAPPAVPSNSNGFSFMDSNFNNGAPQQQQQQFQQQPQSGFSAFDEPPRPPPVPASNTDDFMSFVSAPAPGQQQQQQQQFGFAPPVPPVPAKPQASANDILSLYSNGGGAHHHQMGNGMMRAPGNPMMGGAPHPSHFMNPAGGNQLGGFHPPQHQQFGGMGGFPQTHQQMPQQGQHFGAHQQQQQAPHNPFGALQQQFPGQQQGAPVNPFQQQQQQQQFGQHQHQQQHQQFSQFHQQQPWR